MKFGSSSCRVTGVSSLNLARRPLGLAGFFLSGYETIEAHGAEGPLMKKKKRAAFAGHAGFTASGPVSKKFLRRFFQKAATFC
jgi:hypothetical protein